MGINPFRRMCMDRQQQSEKHNHYNILAQDYRMFERDKWYTFQNPILFDPNKFIFLYANYEQEQEALLSRWKATIPDIKNIEYGQSRNDQDIVSPRWKYAIRRGVPIEYYKIMISVFFNKNFLNLKQNYQKMKNETNFGEPVPLFGLQESSIKEGIIMPFLNERGYSVLKELMYLFKKKKGEFFFNKYIGYIAAILLIFFQDYQAYELISTMMDQSSNMSINRQESLRWHIIFKEEQVKNLAINFFKIVANNSQKLLRVQKHFDKHKIDKVKLFTRVIQGFFIQFLPFPFILRIFILLLNEGIKIFYRVFYAMVVYSQEQLLQSYSLEKSILNLKIKCLNLTTEESTQIIKNSFNLNLKATISAKLIENRLQKKQDQRKYYYIPFIKGVSHILSFLDLQTIWSFLPFQLKSYDLQLKYPIAIQRKEELKLKDLLKSYESSKYNLLVIKTKSTQVFGCFFIGNNAAQAKKWTGNNQSFVFTLYPKVNKYESTRENNQYIFFDENHLRVGSGGSGSAIVLKANLLEGQSYKCFTFRNEPLNEVSGAFYIQDIEAFVLY